ASGVRPTGPSDSCDRHTTPWRRGRGRSWPRSPAMPDRSPTTPGNAAPVRNEDAFDVDALAAWLSANAPDEPALDGTPEVRQFTGGASNLTYLVRYPARDLILRRPPIGTKAKGAHDMRRESDIQRALGDVYDRVP